MCTSAMKWCRTGYTVTSLKAAAVVGTVYTHREHTQDLNRQGEQNARKQRKTYLSKDCSIFSKSLLT